MKEFKYDKLKYYIKGLKVEYKLPGHPNSGRIYRVTDIVEGARYNIFTLSNGEKHTVESYFSKEKNYRIQHTALPYLWVGSKSKKIYLPAELCTIVRGQTQKKMNKQQTLKMIHQTATNTSIRKEKIMDGFAQMNFAGQPTLRDEFNLSVGREFESVPARVLEAPQLQYYGQSVTVQEGVWQVGKFLQSSNLPDNTWTILNLSCAQATEVQKLRQELKRHCKDVNMEIGEPMTPFARIEAKDIKDYFANKKKQNIRLVIVILPDSGSAYSSVKQITELQIPGGILTQCIKYQTIKECLNKRTIISILLKINSKLGGVNHKIADICRPQCFDVPCMIVGADVTHPSPDATNMPSIAAVAASHDPNAFQYNIELRLQPPREEIIQDLQVIMHDQLLSFYRKTRQKPKQIIFYRDGVSEGQLPQVMAFELQAIKAAIHELKEEIPITFLVVLKRQNQTNFDRNRNVQTGTVVDTDITDPTHINFYLVSHASNQSTARPTKYRCICNENKMSENAIEQLTYYLCHMSARCARSVSYPAPTYYAHLATFRARAFIHNVPVKTDNLEEEQKRKIMLSIKETSPMFFV